MNNQPFVVDVRVGCVAVYRGPNYRLSLRKPIVSEVVFYRDGFRRLLAPTHEWYVSDETIEQAQAICDRLNAR